MGLSGADKLEIHELLARYNRAVDSADPDGWADTFTDDGVFESLYVGTHSGREELVRFAAWFWRSPECEAWRGGQHWAGNVIIDGDGDRAHVFASHIMFMPDRDDAIRGVVMAAHDDDVVRVDGVWRFAVRRMRPWPPESTRQYLPGDRP